MKKFKDLDCVLLIDDDRFINLAHSKAVERASIGVEVKAINNVKDALDYLTSSGTYETLEGPSRPGIIFLDINMPGLTGWDFMDMYHQLDETYKAKVIVVMLTTSLNPDDHQRALADGHIVDFLHKPLRPEMVLELAERYFETHDLTVTT
jgi:CheY-like chemotaxis protein